MRQTLNWGAWTAARWLLLWQAEDGSQGAANMLGFVIWGIFSLALLVALSPGKATTPVRRNVVPKGFRMFLVAWFAVALIWTGWIVTAVAYIISCMLLEFEHDRRLKAQQEAKA